MLHLSAESIEASAHVRSSSSKPDPCSLGEFYHRISLSSTAPANAGSTPLSMLTKALPGNSTWIAPPERLAGSSLEISSRDSGASEIRTGRTFAGLSTGRTDHRHGTDDANGTPGRCSLHAAVLPAIRSHLLSTSPRRSAASPQPYASVACEPHRSQLTQLPTSYLAPYRHPLPAGESRPDGHRQTLTPKPPQTLERKNIRSRVGRR